MTAAAAVARSAALARQVTADGARWPPFASCPFSRAAASVARRAAAQ